MKQSESIKNIAGALAKFQASCPEISLNETVTVKTKTGGSYTFKYASLSHIRATIKAPLAENGLSFVHLVDENGGVSVLLMHTSGEFIQSGFLSLSSQSRTAQDVGGLITYAKRYTLSAILGIVTDLDDDANGASGNQYDLDQRPWLNKKDPVYDKVVDAISDGKRTVDKIKETYRLSRAVEKELRELENVPA